MAMKEGEPQTTMKRAVRVVTIHEPDEHDEWLVRVWPGERIVNVEQEGPTAWVYIEREV